MNSAQDKILLKVKIYPEWFLYLFIIFGLVFWIPIAIIFLFSLFSEGKFASLLIVIWFLYFMMRIIFSEINFDEEKIEYRNIFKKYSIKWSEIQTHGVFYRSIFSQRIVAYEETNRSVLFGIRYLFLSKDKNFNPNSIFQKITYSMSSKTIYFIYQPKVSSLIQEKLNRFKAK